MNGGGPVAGFKLHSSLLAVCVGLRTAAADNAYRDRDRELHRYYDNVNNNDCYCYFGITTNWDYGSDYSIKPSIVVIVVVAHKPRILVGSH